MYVVANYWENNKDPLTVEAPKHINGGTIQEVIQYLMSNECVSKFKETFKAPEHEAYVRVGLDIIAEIKKYMRGYEKASAQEKAGLRRGNEAYNMNLVVQFKQEDGSFYSEGTNVVLADLTKRITPHVTKTEVEGQKVETLEIVLGEVPWIGSRRD